VTRRPLIVATYNIHKGRGLDQRLDLRRIGEVLGELQADLVGLQEVFHGQAEVLARSLDMRLVMGITAVRADGPYGNAVLTRLPVRDAHTFDLTRRRREPRGGIRVDLAVAGHTLHVFNVHLGLSLRERAEQVDLLVREHVLAERRDGPRVLVGDLNEWFPGPVGRTLRREFHGVRLRRTHPAPLPLFALDRIYWDRDLHGEHVGVHRSPLARLASDHLPLVARLRLAGHARSRH
jgi:endonuclease/exonuclease/phosphatase family metal-dependent hydrolase